MEEKPKQKSQQRSRRLLIAQSNDQVGDLVERSRAIAVELDKETYECPSCLERIKVRQPVWSCSKCSYVYHFHCIRRWCNMTRGSGTFLCPQCRGTQSKPQQDFCFCGKVPSPKYDASVSAHSCGKICEKERPFCTHKCPLPCHPGPCPRCPQIIGPLPCQCGSTSYTYQCGAPPPLPTCSNPCGHLLSCGKHHCKLLCHNGPCPSCEEWALLACFCGKKTEQHQCSGVEAFGCGEICGKSLPCGFHSCQLRCHNGACPPCPMSPEVVVTCPCGATPLTHMRRHCTDPIPTCDKVCGKYLLCGLHRCPAPCHEGPCAPCSIRIEASCRCRKVRRRLPCADAQNFTCTFECGTRLSCGKHKCKAICCRHRNKPQEEDHLCLQLCGRKMPCGHTCEELCHTSGTCPPCPYVVTEPLRCHCGAEVLNPPQPCGTSPPVCKRACRKARPCGHPVGHLCHFGDCPPCGTIVQRICPQHGVTVEQPCGATELVCDEICDKSLPCGHECNQLCHAGPCVDEAHPCKQVCKRLHEGCQHRCTRLCHGTSLCPPCSVLLRCQCECGRISRSLMCSKVTVDVSKDDKKAVAKVPCDNDCLFAQRLSVLSSLSKTKKEAFIYSLELWEKALEDPQAILRAEKQLMDFVNGAETVVALPHASAPTRSLTHCLSKYYGVHSESVDLEPHRSCLLTKTKDTLLPPVLLSEAVANPKMDPRQFYEQRTSGALREKLCLEISGTNMNERLISAMLSEISGRFVIGPPSLSKKAEPLFLIAFTTQKRQAEWCTRLETLNTQHTYQCRKASPSVSL